MVNGKIRLSSEYEETTQAVLAHSAGGGLTALARATTLICGQDPETTGVTVTQNHIEFVEVTILDDVDCDDPLVDCIDDVDPNDS